MCLDLLHQKDGLDPQEGRRLLDQMVSLLSSPSNTLVETQCSLKAMKGSKGAKVS